MGEDERQDDVPQEEQAQSEEAPEVPVPIPD